MAEARRVLFARTDRLGETLLNLPAVGGLKAAVPQASLACLVREELRPLVAHTPGVDEVLAHDETTPSWWVQRAVGLAARLKPRRFDAVVVSNPKKELHLAVWLAGIPCRIGYDHKWSGLLTRRVPDQKRDGARHEVEYALDLVAALGLPAKVPAAWRLRSFAQDFPPVREQLAREGIDPDAPYLAVHPWASTAAKRWPAERFRQLMGRLNAQQLGPIVVVGGPEHQFEALRVISPGPGVANLVGRLTLVQLAAVLERSRLLVSADSGPVHLAAAVGTPTVVLFGTTDPAAGAGRWGPWGHGHRVIAKPSMAAIEVEEVVDAVVAGLGCGLRGS